MKTILVGKKEPNTKYDFRETCFGICEQNGKLLLVEKNGQASLVGGGVEEGESKTETLAREFMEEAGATIKNATPLCVVDCYWLAAGRYPLRSLSNIFVVQIDPITKKPTEEGHTPIWVSSENAIGLLPLPYQIAGLEHYNKTHKK